jgi:hypothetical protein
MSNANWALKPLLPHTGTQGFGPLDHS